MIWVCGAPKKPQTNLRFFSFYARITHYLLGQLGWLRLLQQRNCRNLSQNFHNPFNPSTKISWKSPVGSHQTLKIYDVFSNERATLVDENKPAVSYAIDFKAPQLKSGVYFYKIQVIDTETISGQGFVETKKMILLR